MGQREPQTGATVVLGEIVGVHGVQGWVKVYSWTRPGENIFDYPEWLLAAPSGEWQPARLIEGRRQGKGLIACLEGVDDRWIARGLMGQRIAVPREALPPAEPGEYYWNDLIGLQVVNGEGVDFGQVVDLIETGANDVLVVSGERERLIPFVPAVYVTAVSLVDGRMQVDWDPED